MFCPNCGNKLNGNEEFCPNCGKTIPRQQDVQLPNSVIEQNPTTQTMAEKLSKSSENFFKPIIEKIKTFIIKYKKQLAIVGLCCFVVILGIVLFNKFYDFTKINWDKENGDANITYTEPTTLTLNVLAYDKEKNQITDIKFEAKKGEIVADGATVKWKLPDKAGSYSIAAIAPSGKKITKKIDVVKLNDSGSLSGMISEEMDDKTADNDNDGLTNEKEKELGTNPNLADSDRDGISDYYEINVTKTDPLKADTDGDGINDGDELDLGLDPLKSDSKGDGVKDGERELTYTINNEKLGVELSITGKGNIPSSTVDILRNSTFSDMDGLLDKVYNFYSDGTIKSATVKIKYDLNEITTQGLSEDGLTLYYFNETTKQLEEIPTTVDKENKLIIVTLEHFSKYVIGDKNTVLTNVDSQIMFVIDNSVSMYSMQQMIDAGYDASTGAIGNDIQFKRLSLTNNLVDMFTGNYKFGVAEFSGNYVNLKKFSDSKADVKKSVNSMRSKWASNAYGTNIITALKSGIDEFSSDQNSHYLLLLTDGKNTTGSLSGNRSAIISSAKEKNVKICVIGLGKEIDTDDLDGIAEATGCDYYNASDSSALDEIYSLVGADINYDYMDTDGDHKIDGMIQANSGFIVNRDGFSFANFRSNKSENGHCYGMATFAMLYYKKELPMSLGYADKHTIFKRFDPSNGYDLNNTYFSSYGKLYDFKTSNQTLTYYLYGIPGDYRDRVEDDTWMIKKEYYDGLVDIGATISTEKYKGGDQKFTKYQKARISIDDEKFNSAVKKADSQILSAIWRLYILQGDDRRVSFSSNPDQAFEELTSSLSAGTPVVTGVAGNHAINSIKLIQDVSDSNKFKIEVYDNNYPGETRYIEMRRSKMSKWQLSFTAWTNEYEYTFKYDTDNDGVMEELEVALAYPDVNK